MFGTIKFENALDGIENDMYLLYSGGNAMVMRSASDVCFSERTKTETIQDLLVMYQALLDIHETFFDKDTPRHQSFVQLFSKLAERARKSGCITNDEVLLLVDYEQ